MAEKQTNKQAMSLEMAQDEFYGFYKRYKRKPKPIEEISKEYEVSIDALVDGSLEIDENGVPTYTLIEPIKKESGEVLYDKLTLRTRILPNTQSSLGKGIDLENDAATYSLVIIAHIIGFASRKELDKLHKFDYEVLSQLSLVFL